MNGEGDGESGEPLQVSRGKFDCLCGQLSGDCFAGLFTFEVQSLQSVLSLSEILLKAVGA